jgi:hypothetical protein
MQKYSQTINQELINFHPVTGKFSDEFVGIKYISDRVLIHYPESFSLTFDNPKTLRNEILSLITSIQYGKSNSQYFDLNDQDDSSDTTPIASMIWVLKDYISNGIYDEMESVYKNNLKGKINWKRTIANTLSKSSHFPLNDSIISENKISLANIIADLHYETLKTSSKHLGWLLNVDSRIFGSSRINLKRIKYYIYLIENEIHRTFNDIQRLRLVNIRKILEWLGEDSISNFSYGTNHYYFVFETIVNRVFGNLSDKIYNPSAKWYLNEEKGFNTNTLRPDTVYLENNRAVIIDSKYYRYGSTLNLNDLPNVDSIQKQTTYLEFFKANFPSYKQVSTAFFMPYNKQSIVGTNNNIKYIGYAISDWKATSKSASDYYIQTYLIDLKSLIYSWKSGNYSDIRSEFYRTIFNDSLILMNMK